MRTIQVAQPMCKLVSLTWFWNAESAQYQSTFIWLHRGRRMAVQMVEKETGDVSNGTQGNAEVDTTSTTAFDKTTSDKPTDESAYDSLSPK